MIGVVLDGCRVSIGATGAPTLVDAGKSNLLASVTRVSAGLYTFQLNPQYYKSLVAVLPALSCVSGAGAIFYARYVEGSYNSSTGQFQVVTSNTTPAAADATQNTALDLLIAFQRYSNI
jgi:hypothetical protein